jgi:uncharacterized protein YdhG (YjbR/CyaY superfamily)
MSKPVPATIRDYIARFPAPIRRRLNQMRGTIKKAAPQAKETISYRIPAFTLNGMLVWFAGFKNHVGLYPRAEAITAFRRELAPYKTAKGSIQFPHDRPLPLTLVSRIVKYRVKQNLGKRR